jgi:hypothetical protein
VFHIGFDSLSSDVYLLSVNVQIPLAQLGEALPYKSDGRGFDEIFR